MTKVKLCVKHNGVEYFSSMKELTPKQLMAIREEVVDATSGRVDYLVVNTGEQELFFPKPILLNSIISLIFYEKE